jgi:pimeloyl-ACP methyl ester carboxylesterase
MTLDTQVLDKTISLNGLRFHYLDWGAPAPDAQAMVCLHGFTSHAHSWDGLAEAMREKYRVLALDQRGHGQTEWASDYHPQRRVEDMEAFVAALGLDRFVLVGLSMGGRAAYQYAARHPETVERLVIVDIAPEGSTAGMGRINDGLRWQDVFDDPEEAFQVARRANARPPDAALRARVKHGLMQRPDGKWTFRYDVALRNGSGARVTATPEEIAADWASLKNITSPTLLVRGVHSDILDPEHAQRMVDTIPNCKLVQVEESGHSVPLDNPRGFLEAVRGFL